MEPLPRLLFSLTPAFFGSIYREKALISGRQVELLAFAQENQKGAELVVGTLLEKYIDVDGFGKYK